MDREKVISEWESVLSRDPLDAPWDLIDETLELLKEKEPVEMEIEGGGASWWYVCEECHGSVDYYDSFCRHCGRPFKKKKSACDGCEYKGSDDCIQGQPGSENAYCPNGKLG